MQSRGEAPPSVAQPVAQPVDRPPAPADPNAPDPMRRRTRRIATIVFLSIVVAYVGTAAGQIAQQILFPTLVPSPYESCAEGKLALEEAIARARHEAEAEDVDADVALHRFRGALLPEWSYVTGIRQTCEQSPPSGSDAKAELRSLDALERLRYAEEHAVRREAASLAALRRQVSRR